MSDPIPPATGPVKVAAASVGAAVIFALFALFGRRHTAPPRPAPAPPVSGTVPSIPEGTVITPTPTPTETMDQAAKDRAARVAAIIAATPVFPPFPDPHYVPPVYGPDLCDHTAAIDVPPNVAAGECLAGTAIWNPAAHNVNWFTAPDTIYEEVRVLPSAIVAGKLPVTFTRFPCGVQSIAFYWARCRLVTVRPPAPSPGVLHASAASIASLPAGHCGLTARDPLTGQVTPLYRCTLEEMAEDSKAWMAQAKDGKEQR